MVPPQLADTNWRKSSRSATQSECVEIAALPTGAAIRDYNIPADGIILLTSDQTGGRLTRINTGQLDI